MRSFTLAPPLAHPDMNAAVEGVLARADDILLVVVMVGRARSSRALLITDVTLGIISRAVPQMNVFMVGLPLKIIVALGGSAILLPGLHRPHQHPHRPRCSWTSPT